MQQQIKTQSTADKTVPQRAIGSVVPDDEATPDQTNTQHVGPSPKVSCPECDGTTVSNPSHAETICSECGLVITEDEIDTGPEWRSFGPDDQQEKTRVGAPTTERMHDKGLSTDIDWKDRDCYGNTLTSRQRQRMQRLRKWHNRIISGQGSERVLQEALGEIDRVASVCDLPDDVREVASVLFRRVSEEDLLLGRSYESVATACLHIAARQEGIPRSLSEMADISRVREKEINSAYKMIRDELNINLPPASPLVYVGQIVSDIDVAKETANKAREILEEAEGEPCYVGKNRVALAASAVYAAGLVNNDVHTQTEVSEAAGVTAATIRNHYENLIDVGTEYDSENVDPRNGHPVAE